MTASTLGLGYFLSGVVFAVLFLLPAIAYSFFGANSIACFLDRLHPDATGRRTLCDWTGRTPDLGGIGIGQLPKSRPGRDGSYVVLTRQGGRHERRIAGWRCSNDPANANPNHIKVSLR